MLNYTRVWFVKFNQTMIMNDSISYDLLVVLLYSYEIFNRFIILNHVVMVDLNFLSQIKSHDIVLIDL